MERPEVQGYLDEAKGILSGDRDAYDGADGARYVKLLCAELLKLLPDTDPDGVLIETQEQYDKRKG